MASICVSDKSFWFFFLGGVSFPGTHNRSLIVDLITTCWFQRTLGTGAFLFCFVFVFQPQKGKRAISHSAWHEGMLYVFFFFFFFSIQTWNIHHSFIYNIRLDARQSPMLMNNKLKGCPNTPNIVKKGAGRKLTTKSNKENGKLNRTKQTRWDR